MSRSTEPSPPAAAEPQSFIQLARAEARRTWGRRPLVWGTAAAALLLACGAVPAPTLPEIVASFIVATPAGREPRLGEALFVLLCALTCWPFAILGADLLSLEFPDNPDPLRAWGPVEIGARAAGRVVPCLGVVAVAVMLYAGNVLLKTPGSTPPTMNGGRYFPEGVAQLPFWWIAWIGVLLASTAPYFAFAALLSATARRPRRWVIAPATVVGVSCAGCVLACGAIWDSVSVPVLVDWFTGFVTPSTASAPNLWTGSFMGAALHQALAREGGIPGIPQRLHWVWWCWLATAGFVVLTLPPGLGTWAIAVRRWQRWGGGRVASPVRTRDTRGAGSQSELPGPEDGTEPADAAEPEHEHRYPPGVPQRLNP